MENDPVTGHMRCVLASILNLRQAIILSIVLGVLLPALFLGGILVRDRYESVYQERVTATLDQYAEILVGGLELPLWNVDPDAARQIVDAILRNQDVVRISVEDSTLGRFLEREAPERRTGNAAVVKREIAREGKLLGYLTVELATGRLDSALKDEALKLSVTLLVQLSVSSILIFLLLESRLVSPLRELRDASRRLALGTLTDPVRPVRNDEIGELAMHFDEMRSRLRDSFSELESKRRDLEFELREHQKAEDENRLLALIASETNNAVIVTDAEGRIEWVNAAFQRLSGYSLVEVHGQRPGDFLHGPETDQGAVEQMAAVIAERSAFRDLELVNYAKDGRRYWVSIDIQPVFDSQGGLVRFFAIERDVTERKSAESALHANHEFVTKVIESLPGIFYLIHPDGRFVLWNRNFERVSGRNGEEVATTRPLDLFEGKDEAVIAEAIAKVFTTGSAEAEAVLVAKDGTATPYIFTGLKTLIEGVPHLLGVGLDVSARRKADEALRAEEAKFSAAINGSLDFISLSRLDDGCFTLVNEAFENLTGWSAAEAIGRTSVELGIWRDPEERRQLVSRLKRGERVQNFNLHLGTRSGDLRECVMSAVVVEIDGVQYMVAVVRDETEQRRADSALRRLAESGIAAGTDGFYQSLVADLVKAIGLDMGFIGLCDPLRPERVNSIAVYANGEQCPPFAYDAIHSPCAGVLAGDLCVYCDDVQVDFSGHNDQLLHGMRSYVGAPLRGDAGQVIGLLAMMHTRPLANPALAQSLVQVFAARASAEMARERAGAALAASQTKFSALFHSSPVAMSVSLRTDAYAVVDVNEVWERQFHRARADVLGRNGLSIGFWRDIADRDAFLAEIERTGEIRSYEAWLQCGDAPDILCRISGKMIHVGDEELMILAEEDVTERRRLERDLSELAATLEQRVAERTTALRHANEELATTLATLQRAQSELVRSEKLAALGSLVAGVAHELNTPIGNCMTVASTLDEQVQEFDAAIRTGVRRSTLEGFTGSARTASDILLRNLRRAAELVASFKQVAVDQTSSQRREFSLEEVVAEILLTLQPTIRKTPYKVVCEVPADIVCDSYPGPLGQALANLINNSILHGFEGRTSGLIRITAQAIAPARFQLVVADDGVGISIADQPRIFDPFFTTKLGKGGSGLGLHIVYNLVTGILGGEISVHSGAEGGTRVVIVAPLSAPHRSDDDGAELSAPTP